MFKKAFSKKQASNIRASHWDALFVGVFTIIATPALALECPSDQIDETVVVSQVVDGDTIRLKDGRKVRLVGINTPELARKKKPAEPLAEQAKQMLASLLEGEATVGIRYGAERKDRHGRTLAHVYLGDGRSVEAELLSAGLAAHIVVPPNTWNRKCYRATEKKARQLQKGVWDDFYRPVPVEALSRDTRGFRVITGRVMQVGESQNSLWLNFLRLPGEGRREGVAVRISRADLGYFKKLRARNFKNKKITVRGWLYQYKKQLVMQIRHPAALEVVKEVWKKQ